jgi:hypothetical protein
MNSCNFLGRLYGDVHLVKYDNTSSADFQLEIENFRRNKNGSKNREVFVFDFQAWDTAALTIKERLGNDDLILVECSARKEQNSVYYRVNRFRIFNKEKFSSRQDDK